MQVPRAETLEGRAETLRSAQSLPRTVAVAVVLVQAPQLLALEALVVASVLKGLQPARLRLTVRGEEAAVRQLA